jgi:flagellar M-ring protein FliF
MIWSDYWGALSSRQRVALLAGVVLITVAAASFGVWLLRDPYVTLASALSGERLSELTHELDRAKLNYRVGENADAIMVPRSELGKARAAVAAGADFGIPPSVGLELFKETDFSTTDFAQRINYQRALQGELTRTIQTIAGVRSARVHVILADTGLFKRDAAKATAAVTVALQPGKSLSPSQVRGIQRLVAASVPEIKIDDVVVLDESGTSLTRMARDGEDELTSAHLELKRQADQYLEGKLTHLLQDLAPAGVASISVDTVLDERQLRVTTDEPMGARAVKEGEHATGVLVKERQSQHGHVSGLMRTDGEEVDGDNTEWEHEYTVGHRMEQTLTGPGSIRRVSVAVALQGAPPGLTSAAVEQLVVSAIGIDHARGDSVSVLLFPGAPVTATGEGLARALVSTPASAPGAAGKDGDLESSVGTDGLPGRPAAADETALVRLLEAALVAVLVAALIGAAWWGRFQARSARLRASSEGASGAGAVNDLDVDAATAKVRQWLSEGATSGRV